MSGSVLHNIIIYSAGHLVSSHRLCYFENHFSPGITVVYSVACWCHARPTQAFAASHHAFLILGLPVWPWECPQFSQIMVIGHFKQQKNRRECPRPTGLFQINIPPKVALEYFCEEKSPRPHRNKRFYFYVFVFKASSITFITQRPLEFFNVILYHINLREDEPVFIVFRSDRLESVA